MMECKGPLNMGRLEMKPRRSRMAALMRASASLSKSDMTVTGLKLMTPLNANSEHEVLSMMWNVLQTYLLRNVSLRDHSFREGMMTGKMPDCQKCCNMQLECLDKKKLGHVKIPHMSSPKPSGANAPPSPNNLRHKRPTPVRRNLG